jgi:hypothetical protein
MSEIRAGLDQLEGGKAQFYTLGELFDDSPGQTPSGQPATDGA